MLLHIAHITDIEICTVNELVIILAELWTEKPDSEDYESGVAQALANVLIRQGQMLWKMIV